MILFLWFSLFKIPVNYINYQWSRKPQSNFASKVMELENSDISVL